MIKAKLLGEDSIHGIFAHLPALPRPGDEIISNGTLFEVSKVHFVVNEDYVLLTVERVES